MIDETTCLRVFAIVPFQEQATYFSRTANDSYTSYDTVAHPKKIKKSDKSFTPALLIVADLVWQIIAPNLSVVPAVNDYLVDGDGTKWIVLEVTQQLGNTVYNLLCRKEA